MKRKEFLTTVIAFFAACGIVCGQDLKSLQSFDGNVNEYLEYNLKRGNRIFKGYGFGEVINALEANFRVAKINCERDSSSLFMYLYLQPPEYVDDSTIDDRHLTGVVIFFEEGDNLREATGKIMESYLKNTAGGPLTVYLTNENMDKLTGLLNKCKCRGVAYRDIIIHRILFE